MKTLKIWRQLRIRVVAMLAAFSLASCSSSDPEGDWDPMIWKSEAPAKTTDGVYHVSETGGEFIFSCRNYSSPWIDSASSNGKYFFPPREENNYHEIIEDWFKAEISGNKLKVVFEKNDSEKERSLRLNVTAGDIFYTFTFKQPASI